MTPGDGGPDRTGDGPSDDELPEDPFAGEPDPFAAAEAEAAATPGGPGGEPGAGPGGASGGDDPFGGLFGAGAGGATGGFPFGGGAFGLGGLPFGDLAGLVDQQGGLGWDGARQFALAVATEGRSEPNVDPVERIRIEQLARVAELHVAKVTGLDPAPFGQGLAFVPVNRGTWAQQTIDAYRPLLERLSTVLGANVEAEADLPPEPDDPFGFLAPLLKMLGPMMLTLTAGSMVGHLARRCFGQYDLPIPRPPSDRLLLCVPNLDEFGAAWSIPADDLRLWICLHEVTHHAVLGVPHVRARLDELLATYVGGFETDPHRLENALGALDPNALTDPSQIQELFADPDTLVGAMQSDVQRELLPRLEALVAVIVGYVDHVMDEIGGGLLSNYGMLTEALRRRRVEADASDRFVERLFGLELTQPAYDRGTAFVDGVVERGGPEALARLWRSERELPTPSEVDAPGLWLARIDLPDT